MKTTRQFDSPDAAIPTQKSKVEAVVTLLIHVGSYVRPIQDQTLVKAMLIPEIVITCDGSH